MKTLLKCALGLALGALVASSRLLFIHFFHFRTPIMDDALDPLNQVALVASICFGAATVGLLLVAGTRYLTYARRRKSSGSSLEDNHLTTHGDAVRLAALILALSLALAVAALWWLPRLAPELAVMYSPLQYHRFQAVAHIREPEIQQWWEAMIDGWNPPNSKVIRDLIFTIRVGNTEEREFSLRHLETISTATDSLAITAVSLDYQNDSDKAIRQHARDILQRSNLAFYNEKTDQFALRQ
jgi:hypothetical protein